VPDQPTFAEIKEVLEQQVCPAPGCGERALTLEEKFIARPIGSHALAGSQLKVSAVKAMVVTCGACGKSGTVRAAAFDEGQQLPT
jgi:hypothetical protein